SSTPPTPPPAPPPPAATTADTAPGMAWQAAATTATTAAPPPPPPPPPTPTKEPRGGGFKLVLIVVGVVVGVLVLIAIGLLIGNAVTGSGKNYTDLQVGDCFQEPSERFSSVDTVACTDEHDLEVYALLDYPAAPDAPFPGMEELIRYASQMCLGKFRDYAGVPFESLNLRDVYITPRESAWEDGARRIVCAVGAANEQPTNTSVKAGA
ncbi:MAG: septum formation family protein, partial [Acidimicrobiales bacterium]